MKVNVGDYTGINRIWRVKNDSERNTIYHKHIKCPTLCKLFYTQVCFPSVASVAQMMVAWSGL